MVRRVMAVAAVVIAIAGAIFRARMRQSGVGCLGEEYDDEEVPLGI